MRITNFIGKHLYISLYKIIILILLASFLQSCVIEKRHYRSGFYINTRCNKITNVANTHFEDENRNCRQSIPIKKSLLAEELKPQEAIQINNSKLNEYNLEPKYLPSLLNNSKPNHKENAPDSIPKKLPDPKSIDPNYELNKAKAESDAVTGLVLACLSLAVLFTAPFGLHFSLKALKMFKLGYIDQDHRTIALVGAIISGFFTFLIILAFVLILVVLFGI